VSLLFAIAPARPLGRAGKFVAAAYIVFVALILVYVTIMAVRAQRLERQLDELRRDVEAARAGSHGDRETEALLAAELTRSPAVASPEAERGPA
jgi:hypothetical protein